MKTNPSDHIATGDYYAGTRSELRAYIPAGHQKVLEVGCGEGGFRANLAQDAEVWGVEPMAAAAAIASGRLHRVVQGAYEEVASQLPDGYFDLVICNDVIEHMADDLAFLRAIQKKMRPGGKIMGSVPNVRNWYVLRALVFDKEWEYQDSGVLDRTHLRFYTIKSFPRLLTAAGFHVERFDGINRTVYLRNTFMRKLLRTRWLNDTHWLQFAFVASIRAA